MKNLEAWGKHRTVFALMIYSSLIYGFVNEMIDSDVIVAAFSGLTGYYFAKKSEALTS